MYRNGCVLALKKIMHREDWLIVLLKHFLIDYIISCLRTCFRVLDQGSEVLVMVGSVAP